MTTSRKNALRTLAAVGASCVASVLVTPQAAGRPGASDSLDASALLAHAASAAADTSLSTLQAGRPALATAD
jgi:hypothetical protein